MNNFNLSEEKQQALLQMAAQKLGKSPQELMAQLQSGQLDGLTQSMDPKTSSQVNALLNNPKTVEMLLNNGNIRSMLENLGKGQK